MTALMTACAAQIVPPEIVSMPTLIQTQMPAPLRVLVVEDDPESAELVRMYLARDEDGSFCMERAANLLDAMQRLAHPGIDVVLLDLGLPELTGYRSHFAITHAAQRKLPVVIFTGDESDTSKMSTMTLGAADYLVKDQTSPAQLRSALRRAVQKGWPGRLG